MVNCRKPISRKSNSPTTAIKWKTNHGKNKERWLTWIPMSTKKLTRMPMEAKTLSKMTISKSKESFRFPSFKNESKILSFAALAPLLAAAEASLLRRSSSSSSRLNRVYQMADEITTKMWKTRKNMATKRTKVVRAQQHCLTRKIMFWKKKKKMLI